MKFTINPDEIKTRNIPKDVFFYVLALYFDAVYDEDTFKKANSLGFNIKDTDKYRLSKEGAAMIERIFIASADENIKADTAYDDIARALMSLFPEGFKPGTHLLWRGSAESVADRLRYLDYKAAIPITKESAVKATKEYLSAFDDDKEFMQTLPSFIFQAKQISTEDDVFTDWKSNLLSFIENA